MLRIKRLTQKILRIKLLRGSGRESYVKRTKDDNVGVVANLDG